jgi:hypothetical protein
MGFFTVKYFDIIRQIFKLFQIPKFYNTHVKKRMILIRKFHAFSNNDVEQILARTAMMNSLTDNVLWAHDDSYICHHEIWQWWSECCDKRSLSVRSLTRDTFFTCPLYVINEVLHQHSVIQVNHIWFDNMKCEVLDPELAHSFLFTFSGVLNTA